MEAGSIIRIAMTTAGIAVMLCSFWFLSVKKMTADFAVIWEILGVLLIMIGAVPGLSGWTQNLFARGEQLVICIGTAGVFFCYLFSLLISRLSMKNHGLAIEVSMLLQEQSVEREEQDQQENIRQEAAERPRKELLIILPVKNEEKNIGKVLEQLCRSDIIKTADILCINDASTDASGEIIDQYPCAQIRNVFGLGYGSAPQLGYKYAVRKKYQYVIQMDADGQHDVCNIPIIYSKLRAADTNGECSDIVLASRFMEGSSPFYVSTVKKFAFWLFRTMIYAVTGRRIADPTTGLQGLSKRAFTCYAQYNNFDHQYPDANMVMQMLLLNYRLTEVPAVMHVRTDGKSMHSGLEPISYMLRMFLSVLAVVFRIKVLKQQ